MTLCIKTPLTMPLTFALHDTIALTPTNFGLLAVEQPVTNDSSLFDLGLNNIFSPIKLPLYTITVIPTSTIFSLSLTCLPFDPYALQTLSRILPERGNDTCGLSLSNAIIGY